MLKFWGALLIHIFNGNSIDAAFYKSAYQGEKMTIRIEEKIPLFNRKFLPKYKKPLIEELFIFSSQTYLFSGYFECLCSIIRTCFLTCYRHSNIVQDS